MTTLRCWTLVLMVATTARGTAAQNSTMLHKVWGRTVEGFGASAISPDGKWLVYTKELNVAPGNTEVWIKPLPDGAPRRLLEASNYGLPQLTPDGRRLLLVSSALNRSPSDQNLYVIAAPFDDASGTLSGPLRQITLDAVQTRPRSAPRVSPDGSWLAYTECCATGALKIVPISGGNARVLYTPQALNVRSIPGSIGWSPDGRAVFFQVGEGDVFARMRVSVAGGTAEVLGRSDGPPSRPMGDGKTWVSYESGSDRTSSILRFTNADGTIIGQPLELPISGGAALMNAYVSKGSFLIRVTESNAPLSVAPVAGGPIREVSPANEYHWMTGWSRDGKTSYGNGPADNSLKAFSSDGKVIGKWSPPEGLRFVATTADGFAILRSQRTIESRIRYASIRLEDGTRQDLGAGGAGSATRGASGTYLLDGSRFLLSNVTSGRLQVHSVGVAAGDSRLVLDVPASPKISSGFSVHGDRVVFTEESGDSLLLRFSAGPNSPVKTLAVFTRMTRLEHAWSPDGRTLAVADAGSTMWFIAVDSEGTRKPLPPAAKLPFTYFYELFWLPDGSGVTVIAQPNGSPTTHVVLVRVTDPERPVNLTREDGHDKWGHLVSPDSKYVVYESERYLGSTLWSVDLEQALKQAKGQ